MTESILISIKKLLGITNEYTHFDADIVMHINTVFATLHQLAVGPEDVFLITGPDETWDQFIQDKDELNMVKTYIYLKVRLLFDPPTNSAAIEAMKAQAAEYEWRLNAADDDWKEPIEDDTRDRFDPFAD